MSNLNRPQIEPGKLTEKDIDDMPRGLGLRLAELGFMALLAVAIIGTVVILLWPIRP
jgi:hypothetical protein